MERNDTINVTRTTYRRGNRLTYTLTEEEFRQLFGGTLAALAAFAGAKLPPEVQAACASLGEFFSSNDPIGDAEDFSLLGTFQVVNQVLP